MAGENETLSLTLLGRDVSASRALAAVGRQAQQTALRLAAIGTTTARTGTMMTVGLQAAAQLGQSLATMGAGAGVLAPALLTAGQALGTIKLVGEQASKELERLKPQFEGIQRVAGDAFGPQFSRAVTTFATNLPVVREGVRQTAAVLGDLSRAAANVFSGPAFRADLANVMSSNARATRSLGEAGIYLAGAFWDVVVAAQATWENFTSLINVGARTLALWIEQKRESGELAAAIQRGATEIGAWVSAIWNFGVGLKSIFSAISADGRTLGEVVFDLSTKFRNWATDAENVNRIAGFFDNLRTAASTAWAAVNTGLDTFILGWQGAKDISQDDPGWLQALRTLGESARTTWTTVENDLLPALRDLGDFLIKDLGPPLATIASEVRETFITNLGAAARVIKDELLPPLRDNLVPILENFVVPAMERLGTFVRDTVVPNLERLADLLGDQLNIALGALRDVLEDNEEEFRLLGGAILQVLGLLSELAPLLALLTGPMWIAVGAITLLAEAIALTVRWAQVLIGIIQDLISWFMNLGGVFGQVRDTIFGIGEEIIGWFSGTFREGIIAVFAGAGMWLLPGGTDIMDGLRNGILGSWNQTDGWLRGSQERIAGHFSGSGGWLRDEGTSIQDGLRGGMQDSWSQTDGWMRGTGGRISGYFAGSGGWLRGHGSSIMSGLMGGMRSIWDSTISGWLSGLGQRIRDLKGPIEKDKLILVPAGNVIFEGFLKAMQERWREVERWLSTRAAEISATVSMATSGGGLGGVPPPLNGFTAGVGTTINVYLTANIAGTVTAERDLAEAIAPRVRDAITVGAGSNGRRTGF